LKENRLPLLQLEDQGIFKTYAVEPDIAVRLPLNLERDVIEEGIARRLEAGRDLNVLNQQEAYVTIVNGLQALREIDGIRGLGIISPYRRIFAVGLESKPVVSYPFDPRPESPELDDIAVLGEDVDILMILRADDSAAALRERLLALVGDLFFLRKQTRFWDMYQRKDVGMRRP